MNATGPDQSPGTFGLRLGFARWLRHLVEGEAPGHADIGRAVGVTGPAVSLWMGQDKAPKWDYHRALADYLGVDKDWLIEGIGEPPHKQLWRLWIARREGIEQAPPAEPEPYDGKERRVILPTAPPKGTQAKPPKRRNSNP
jgi:hypothetical protein